MTDPSPQEALEREQALLTVERMAAAAGNPVLSYALHYHRTDRGDPLSFAGRPWLLALYRMWGEAPPVGTDVVFMKATQVGISEMMIVLSWAWCGELGYRLMYVLPRDEDRTAFYAMRMKKPLKHVPRYQALTRQTSFDSRSEYLISIGKGFFRLAGSNASETFTSIPLDAYVIDELDKCDQENILLAEDRLSWSDSRKVRIRIANPTVSDFGISRLFDRGTRHRWNVPCLRCGKEKSPNFFDHVIRELPDGSHEPRDAERWKSGEGDLRLVCECGGELDRSGPGRWVAEYPERECRSFQMGKLIDGSVSVRSIVRLFLEAMEDTEKLQRFYNSTLGVPFTPKGSKLTAEIVRSRRFNYSTTLPVDLWGPTRTMGIDVGSPHTVVVSDIPAGPTLQRILQGLGKATKPPEESAAFDPKIDRKPPAPLPRAVRRLLFAGKVRSLDAIDELVRRFSPRCICIDAFPEVEAVMKARLRWGRLLGSKTRIWRVQYAFDRIADLGLDYREGILKVDRTHALDLQVRDWVDGWRIVPREVESLAKRQYVEELCFPTRVMEETSRGIPVARWTKGKDHFFHAEGYDRLALELCRSGGVTLSDEHLLEGL